MNNQAERSSEKSKITGIARNGKGTDLYERMIVNDDGPHAELNRQVWAGTPFMIDVFTGPCGHTRDRDIRHWLRENMGQEAWPFGDHRPGRWRMGGATVNGWTWYGFETEADMKAFEEAWPAPVEAPTP